MSRNAAALDWSGNRESISCGVKCKCAATKLKSSRHARVNEALRVAARALARFQQQTHSAGKTVVLDGDEVLVGVGAAR